MHNDRANPDTWAEDDEVSAERLETLDANAFAAVNGDTGGDWAPASEIDIGGHGLRARLRFDLIATPTSNGTFQADTTRVIRLTSSVAGDLTLGLSATNALDGDVIEVFADAAFGHRATIQDQAGSALFIAGNDGHCDGASASFIFLGGSWQPFRAPTPKVYVARFTANGVWTCPPGVTTVVVRGWGGGGGGGGGMSGSTSSGVPARGGGGGACALEASITLSVADGDYSVAIGAAGPGGSGSTGPSVAPHDGTDGGTTALEDPSATLVATFIGGRGGAGITLLEDNSRVARGGNRSARTVSSTIESQDAQVTTGGGGHGGVTGNIATTAALAGADNARFAGGAAGASTAPGASISGWRGGGAGGGGGAGPGGPGGNGRDGGAANPSGVGAGGAANGSVPAANTGAGGGGGGGAGAGTTGGIGGAGFAGSSGYLEITWVK